VHDATVGPLRLTGSHVVLRSLTEADHPALEQVMASPGVRAWWWDFDIGDFARHTTEPDVEPFVIEHDGEVVGYLQVSEEDSIQYRFAGIDLALRDDAQGGGLGTDAVGTIARWLFDARGHHRLTIDPARANARAIRCYEKVGFRPVGVLREYERGADGTWHDGLLMELLARELR
jgi:aminoglycoside 6'-N-acetyltransferase